MSCAVKEIEAKSILTKSNLPVSDYCANPYVGCTHACKYCYASFMKRFTNHLEPWGEFVDVKTWPKIKNPQKYAGKEIFIGSVTDPYQPLEDAYRRTRALLEQLQGVDCKITIATKSDLVIRDFDLIKTFDNIRISWSINTLDERFRADMDDGVSIDLRLKTMKVFHDCGIMTTCFISPIFPGITDVKEIITRVKDQCNYIWLENLNLRGDYKTRILNYISEKHPELMSLYSDIYLNNNRSYWEHLDNEMREFTKKEGLLYVRNDDSIKPDFDDPPVVVNYFFHEEIVKK